MRQTSFLCIFTFKFGQYPDSAKLDFAETSEFELRFVMKTRPFLQLTAPTAKPVTSLHRQAVTHVEHTIKKLRQDLLTKLFYGAPGRDRTGDLRVTNALLCQLSHGSIYEDTLRIYPCPRIIWRRTRDSNPRGCYTLLDFQSSPLATRSILHI